MALASTTLSPWQLCSVKSGIFGSTQQAFVGRTQMKAGKRKSKGMMRITACDVTEVSVVDDDGVLLPAEMAMGKRQLMTNLLLLGAVSLPNAGMLLPYPSYGLQEAKISKSSFPADFLFGTSTSAYQIEGAANEGGKGPSIWDTFTHQHPEKIQDHKSGDVASDSYNRYKENVSIMKDIGLKAHRFSISWPRILPKGNLNGGVNPEGIKYYKNFIDELIKNGIEPFVTIFHWDLPQALQDQYGGFLSPYIVGDFADYADVCFREFGDRVKHWITLNEPETFSVQGYSSGKFPPLRCSDLKTCKVGDSRKEPYMVTHHLILAHAAAVDVYRRKYQDSQKGQIGIALNAVWTTPNSDSQADKDAASRAVAFQYDWYLEPLHTGAYPEVVVKTVGDRLPKFTPTQKSLVKGSYDFVGINYYTTYYASNNTNCTNPVDPLSESCANLSPKRNGVAIGPKAGSIWLYVYPQGIQEMLEYTKEKYNNPIVYITENGVSEVNDGSKILEDQLRIDSLGQHLVHINNAIKNGSNVKGYFAWSLLDSFEWVFGYTVRFGLVYVDYNDGQKRYLKQSASWLKDFLLNGKEI